MPAIRVAADPQYRPASTLDLTCHEPHYKSDTPSVRSIAIRAMDYITMVQRHLAELQHDVDRLCLVDHHVDTLTALQQVIVIPTGKVIDQALQM